MLTKNRELNISRVTDDKDVEGLIEALENEKTIIRGEAARALGLINDVRAIEPLGVLLTDNERFVRSEAAIALGNIGGNRAVELLMRAWVNTVQENNPFSEILVLSRALAKAGGDNVVEYLAQFLNKDWYIREAVIISLGEIGKPAIHYLNQTVEDKTDCVKQMAREALNRINKY